VQKVNAAAEIPGPAYAGMAGRAPQADENFVLVDTWLVVEGENYQGIEEDHQG
jgi:hypothetical protein